MNDEAVIITNAIRQKRRSRSEWGSRSIIITIIRTLLGCRSSSARSQMSRHILSSFACRLAECWTI